MTLATEHRSQIGRVAYTGLRLIGSILVAVTVSIATNWESLIGSGLFGAAYSNASLSVSPGLWGAAIVIPGVIAGWPLRRRDLFIAPLALAVQFGLTVLIQVGAGFSLGPLSVAIVFTQVILLEALCVVFMWAIFLASQSTTHSTFARTALAGAIFLGLAWSAIVGYGPASLLWVVFAAVFLLTVQFRGPRNSAAVTATGAGVLALMVVMLALLALAHAG